MRTVSLVRDVFVLYFGAVLGRLSVVHAYCLGLLLMMACTSYTRGDVFRVDGLGTHRFECLDLQLTPLFDLGRSWVPIRYAFGNPCQRTVSVDLSLVRVRASLGGEEISLEPYDPHSEIRSAWLDGGTQGMETIAYEIPESWVGQTIVVCVNLEAVTERLEDNSPFCFDWRGN